MTSDDWKLSGLCRQSDPALWFPEANDSGATRKARGICSRCPVQPRCLEYALDRNEQFGVWGGTSPQERARFRHPSARKGNAA
jgi:WhiB family redox-sensing transcriptional regulator